MSENENAVNNSDSAANQDSTLTDSEVRIQALEAEKAKLLEEKDNWKTAALKYKNKARENPEEGDDDERLRAFAKEALADSRLAEIAREQDSLLQTTIKENRELKLALKNKETAMPSAATGSHSETAKVSDTLVTADQLAYFKSKGWDDKRIEAYKKNLLRNTK